MSRCQLLEPFQVLTDEIDHVVPVADGPVGSHGGDDVYVHVHCFFIQLLLLRYVARDDNRSVQSLRI